MARENQPESEKALSDEALAKKRSEAAKKAAATRKANEAKAAAEAEAASVLELDDAPATDPVDDEVAALKAQLAAAEAKIAEQAPKQEVLHQPKTKNQDAQELMDTDGGSISIDPGREPGTVGINKESFIDVEPASTGLPKADNERMNKLAFLEEVLEVEIHETTDPSQERTPYLSINGVGPGPNGYPYIPRGVPIKMKRKFVEALCHARPIDITTYEARNDKGEQTMKQRRTSALKYPFSVIHDPNPKGRAWLQAQLGRSKG